MARPVGGNNERRNDYNFFPSVDSRMAVKNKVIKLKLK